MLARAERELSEIAANEIDFDSPPYDFAYLRRIHKNLFRDIYEWAGAVRTVDISKGDTHFCNVNRIVPEADRIFRSLAQAGWLVDLSRERLVEAAAECFGDLNMIHPFREGNGRAQRILFEHLVVNAGYEISWWGIDEAEWIAANIDAVICDYAALKRIFERCIGNSLPT